MLLVTNPRIPSLFQQPGKLNLKAYSNVTDAIGKINLKDAGLLHSKLTKGGSVHAPLATPENMDLGTDYAAVSTFVSPYFIPGSPSVLFPFLPPCYFPPSLPPSLHLSYHICLFDQLLKHLSSYSPSHGLLFSIFALFAEYFFWIYDDVPLFKCFNFITMQITTSLSRLFHIYFLEV